MTPDTKLLIIVMLGSTILCVCGPNEAGVHKRRRIERQATTNIWDRLTPFPTWNLFTTRRWSTWEHRTYTPRPWTIRSAWTFPSRSWSTWEPRTHTTRSWPIWSAWTFRTRPWPIWTTRSWSFSNTQRHTIHSSTSWSDTWSDWTSGSNNSVSPDITGMPIFVPVIVLGIVIVIVVVIVVPVAICKKQRAQNRPRAMYPLANQPVAVPAPINTAQLLPGVYRQQTFASPNPVATYPPQYPAHQPMVQNQGDHAYEEVSHLPSDDEPPPYNEAIDTSVYPPATAQPVTGGPGYVSAAPTGYNNPSYADTNVTNTGGTVGNSGTTTTVDSSETAMN